MIYIKALLTVAALSLFFEQAGFSQSDRSFFEFVKTQYFGAGRMPSVNEILGPSDPNIEDSKDGLSNAAVFSGRCWDKKLYRDFSTNGALVVYRYGSKTRFYVVNMPLTANNELAPESYFDSKKFRPWTDVSESLPYPSLTSVVPYQGSLLSMSYENLQGFLLRKMGENYYSATVAITPGQDPSVGEVQIACNFFKRLDKIPDPAVLSRIAVAARLRAEAELRARKNFDFGPPTLGGVWFYHYNYNGQNGWPVPPWAQGNSNFPGGLLQNIDENASSRQ